MKISKVKHKKTAVGKQINGTRGVMYQTPSETIGTVDLNKWVKERSNESAGLYSVLNRNAVQFMDDRQKQKVIKNIIHNFSSVFTGNAKREPGIYVNGLCDYKKTSKDIKNIIDEKGTEKIDIRQLGYESEEGLAEDVIAYALRNSLRREVLYKEQKYFLPDIAKKLLVVLSIRQNFSEYEKIPEKEVMAFVDYVYKDRMNMSTRRRQKGEKGITRQQDIVNSIRKKDVKVQVFDCEGQKRFMPSNANHAKKKYVFEFMKKFAACQMPGEQQTQDVQNRLIAQIRLLIVLFVYGSEQYDTLNQNGAFLKNPWGRLPQLAEGKEDELFGRYIIHYNENKEKQEIDGITEQLFEEIQKNDNNIHRQFDRKVRDILLSQFKSACWKIDTEFFSEKDKSKNGKVMTTEEAVFWISFFERGVEKFAQKRKKRKKEYYKCSRICDMLWEKWFSYMAVKYIELGKAVYYFGTPNLYSKIKQGEEIVVGPVLEEYRDGLTSFDYEKVKADESLIRNIATSVTFAANAFANAAVNQQFREVKDDNSDVFGDTLSQPGAMRDGAMKRILCYFGGSSLYRQELELLDTEDINSERQFCIQIKNHIEHLRNTSYHFSTDRSTDEIKNSEWALNLFKNEYQRVKSLIGEKYMSNNAAMFYSEKKLYALAKKLYASRVEREAQIPAFNSIVKKKDIRWMTGKTQGGSLKTIYADDELIKKYESCLFFMFKEIYYYGFLREDNLLERFVSEVLKFSERDIQDNTEKRARSSFLKRCKELGIIFYESNYEPNKRCYVEKVKKTEKCSLTFGQVCQQIMTDYNMQNQGRKEIASLDKSKWQERNGYASIYEHYVALLKKCVRGAFKSYLSETKEFTFLFSPELKKDSRKEKYIPRVSVEEFTNGMPEIGIFSELGDLFLHENDIYRKENETEHDLQFMYDWYISAHFMSAKQLNLLIGDLKSYKAFVNDICNRAKITDNGKAAERIRKAYDEQRYSDILKVLEFVILFVGKIGKNINDYFGLGRELDADEEYAEYLRQFIDFDSYVSTDISDKPNKSGLLKFCGDAASEAGERYHSAGIYFDEENPIVNKNIIYSLLYGDGKMLRECFRENRVTLDEITGKQNNSYCSLAKSLKDVFRNGKCETVTEQNNLRRFQNLKNRIELLDLQIYTEIVNEFMAQLISWAYLRERDLLHFQLGFHYVRLFFTNYLQNSGREEYNKLSWLNVEEGAILYQILAMYDHALPILKIESKKDAAEKKVNQIVGSPGVCVPIFCTTYDQDTYYAGLQFFGAEARRDYYVDLRNYIAHMRYYTKHDRSILELLGEMYNGFMIYDTKLKKSVSFITKNILERYHIVANTYMQHGDRENPEFRYIAALSSDKFTYKGNFKYTYFDKKAKQNREKRKKVIEVNSRSDLFVELLDKIINYKIIQNIEK